MTERIDHAAEAKRILNEGLLPGRQPHPAVEFAHARVHATLALVEQQRMANRIALAVAVRADHDGGGVLGYFSTDEKEALGFA